MKRPECIRQLQLEQAMSDTIAVGGDGLFTSDDNKVVRVRVTPHSGSTFEIEISVDVLLYCSRLAEFERSSYFPIRRGSVTRL